MAGYNADEGDGVRHNRPTGLMTPTSSEVGVHVAKHTANFTGCNYRRKPPIRCCTIHRTDGAVRLLYGTFIINLSASFVIGFFLIWSTERVLVDPRWRTFVAIGFCGSYSTYSSYAFETLALFEKGQWAAAAANILCTNVLCFLAVVLGAALARGIR
jgi:CrcB protein